MFLPRFEKGPAIVDGQHEVKQDQIGLLSLDAGKCLGDRGGGIGAIAFVREVLREEVADEGFVLDDQHPLRSRMSGQARALFGTEPPREFVDGSQKSWNCQWFTKPGGRAELDWIVAPPVDCGNDDDVHMASFEFGLAAIEE